MCEGHIELDDLARHELSLATQCGKRPFNWRLVPFPARCLLDPEVVHQQGRAALRDLGRLMEFGSLEVRREFVRAFVTGVTVHPDQRLLEVRIRKIPATVLPQPGSSVGLVAGARFEPLQKNLIIRSIPLDGDLLAGLRAA